MTAYQLLVATHVGTGMVALATFWGAAALRKGSPLHRRVAAPSMPPCLPACARCSNRSTSPPC